MILACGFGTSTASSQRFDPLTQREFVDGMVSYAHRDYRQAERIFRRILDRDPSLLRIRLELARTLFMARQDEQADYQFRLASAAHPPAMVARNIVRFREAIRARRSWRFNFSIGLAPDSNINSATDRETVDIYGLPFHLDPNARARSATGTFIGGDASMRFNRFGKLPVYVEAYGQWLRYGDHRFDDAYLGGSFGPEIGLAGGRLRVTATGLQRWYGGHPLVTSAGGQLSFEKLIGDKLTFGAAVLARHNDYAGHHDLDGWDVEARASVDRPLGPTTLGFANTAIERDVAHDSGQAFWRGRLGLGVIKEIGWGLRPRLSFTVARQVNDGPLAPFGKARRDWLLEGNFSIYKRDWNLRGFAPSFGLTVTRNRSTLSLYEQKRVRGELRLTRAF
jgi:hypothetical protein